MVPFGWSLGKGKGQWAMKLESSVKSWSALNYVLKISAICPIGYRQWKTEGF